MEDKSSSVKGESKNKNKEVFTKFGQGVKQSSTCHLF